MAGMQRFVTYIYSYKGNEKLQNTGFAKVEIRGGQCSLEIHLKGALSPGKTPGIYLFSREDDLIHAVEIGNLTLSSGGGDCKVILQSGKIAGSPYSIYDMKGIIIPLDDNFMYASQWDDGAILRERIRIWKLEGEDKDASERIEGEAEREKVAEEQTFAERKDDIDIKEAEPEGTVSDGESETFLEGDSDSRESTFAETESEKAVETVEEAASVHATELPLQKQPPKEDTSQKTLLDCFLKLQKRQQTVEIFETGKRQISGIQIELRDIRELPRKFWNLGNNSFLLHGFFNYHYLLLGKRTEEDKETIFIGVPGMFHSQEHVMASLFGFSEFLPGRKEGERQQDRNTKQEFQEIESQEQFLETLRAAELERKSGNQFGYWCHFMMDERNL